MADFFDDSNNVEEDDDIIILHNEETDKDEEYYHLATYDLEDRWFAVLQPVEPVEGIGEDEVLIYELVEGKEGTELVAITDEDLLARAYDRFCELLEEMGCEGDCGCCDDPDCHHHEE